MKSNKNIIIVLALSGVFSACSAGETGTPADHLLFSFTKPVHFRWSGPYVGGYIGGAWGHSNVTTTVGPVTDTSYFQSTANINVVNHNGSTSFDPSAFIAGLQLGDNWMYKNYVYGVVLDYGSFGLSDALGVVNSAYPDASGDYTLNTSISTDWLYTVRGRLGWTPALSWPLMIYATGGLAVTRLHVANSFVDSTTLLGVGGSNSSDTKNGWTIGGGIEFPVTQNLTINSEYLYADFGSIAVNSSIYNSVQGFGIDYQSLVSPFISSANLSANFFKVGLNYKFSSSV